ncbi:DUF2744 domain-containing protein [Corynebacterium sp. H127]|uniref:phage gene 29 protein family protein n=1 Tax=Corynebacterium sp. H127 TaxID=3133418 RepID=UPI0030A583C3
MSIPTLDQCNINDPEEMFLWALVCLPGLEQQAPLLMPPQILRQISQRLYDCGARLDLTQQQIKYVPPADQSSWLAGAGGTWVPIDAELPPEITAPSIDHLSRREKIELVKKLEAEGLISQPQYGPALDTAEVRT